MMNNCMGLSACTRGSQASLENYIPTGLAALAEAVHSSFKIDLIQRWKFPMQSRQIDGFVYAPFYKVMHAQLFPKTRHAWY